MSEMTRTGECVSGTTASAAALGAAGGDGVREAGAPGSVDVAVGVVGCVVGAGSSSARSTKSCSCVGSPNATCTPVGCVQRSSHGIVSLIWNAPSALVVALPATIAACPPARPSSELASESAAVAAARGCTATRTVRAERAAAQNGVRRDSRFACRRWSSFCRLDGAGGGGLPASGGRSGKAGGKEPVEEGTSEVCELLARLADEPLRERELELWSARSSSSGVISSGRGGSSIDARSSSVDLERDILERFSWLELGLGGPANLGSAAKAATR